MTIDYELTIEDMVALATYHSEHSPRERRRRLMVQVFIVVVFLFLIASALSSVFDTEIVWTPLSASISFLPLICPAILVVLVFTPAVRHWSTRRSIHKAFGDVQPGEVVARQRLTMTAGGIDIKTETAEGFIGWPDIRDVSFTDRHLFIFTDSEQAVVVPQHAFDDRAAFQAFEVSLGDRWAAAADLSG